MRNTKLLVPVRSVHRLVRIQPLKDELDLCYELGPRDTHPPNYNKKDVIKIEY